MWDKFKVRCSAIKRVMANSASNPCITEKQEIELKELEKKSSLTEVQKAKMCDLIVKRENKKKVILSDGCIEYLMECYAWEKEGMIPVNKESLDLWQIKKGKMGEEEARLLLCFVDNVIYKVHKDRISNDYLSGEIDVYLGESVLQATNITDIKNSSDYPTYLKKINNGLENGQMEQVQGYCDIASAGEGWIANCLVDAPDEIIEDMKYRVSRKFGSLTVESPEFLEKWAIFERSMRFEKIHPMKRVNKIKIEPFSKFEQQAVYDRVKVCREWLFNFDEIYSKLI